MANTPNWVNRTILVVEDEEVNRFFFKTALQITNVNVLFAEDGIEAVEMVLKHENIDCILMDIRMPGIDGYEATRHIKNERKDIPIIVQTAYALTNERLKAYDAGCDEYLSKPIKINRLYEVIEKYMKTNVQVE